VPLAGPVCCQTGQPENFPSCLKRSHAGGCNHPLPLLKAMENNAKRRAGIGISSSVLGMCPRQHVLQERNDYYEDPKDYYNRWRGSFGHYAIEMGGPYPGVVQEIRFRRNISVEGVSFTISGQPDWIEVDRRHIEDHKFTNWPPSEVKPDHEAQVNVYIWLIQGGYIGYCLGSVCQDHYPGHPDNPIPEGFEVETAAINYMTTKGYVQFPVTIWSDDAVQAYITRRLIPHARYIRTGNLGVLRIEDEEDKWKARYCPFHKDHNPGRCCMAAELGEEDQP
jgi:hypothetical protein